MSGSIFEFQLGLPKYHKKEIICENGTVIEDLVDFRPLNVSKSIGNWQGLKFRMKFVSTFDALTKIA